MEQSYIWIFCGAGLALHTAAAVETTVRCDVTNGRCQNLEPDEQKRLRLKAGNDGFTDRGDFVSRPVDLGRRARVRVDWIAQWTAPQRWKKHEANPIYGPKQSGEWDSWCNGVSIVRNPDGKSYKMFYSGRAGAGIGFAEALIADPLTWKENPSSPVLKPRADNWEGNLINQPRVVKVTDTHWRMYYTGWGFKGKGSHWAMGLAESFDGGLTWKRATDDPILERGGDGSPDEGGVFVPEVRRIGNQWYAWYTAMKIAADKQNIHLCLATSADGVHWTKHPDNPVLTDDFSKGPGRNVTSRCFVRNDHGVFQIWYSHAKPDYRIRYAESLDGIHWERSPIPLALDASPAPAWDDRMVEYPEVDVVNDQWRLWFCGNGFGTVGFAEGIVETGVDLLIRSGDTPEPGKDWSDWLPIARDAEMEVGRHAQLKADLWSKNRALSPSLNAINLKILGQP